MLPQVRIGPVMVVSHSVLEMPGLLKLVLTVHVHGGVPGRVHLIGRVERREVDLKLVVILPASA